MWRYRAGHVAERLAGRWRRSRPAARPDGARASRIVHGLMKRQNGTITLDSRPGEGTQVRLAFPAAPDRTLH